MFISCLVHSHNIIDRQYLFKESLYITKDSRRVSQNYDTSKSPVTKHYFYILYRTQLLQILYSRHQILHKKSTETPTRLLLCSYLLVWWHLPLRSCLPRPSWVLFDIAMTLTRKEERCTSKRKGARKPYLGIVSSCWI